MKLKLGAAIAFAGAIASLPAIAQTTIKIGYATAPTSHYGVGSTAFCDDLEKRTAGRYKCQQFANSALGGEREMIEAVQLGTLDVVNTSTGPVGNFVPEVNIVDIPFLFRDYDHARKTLDGPIGQDLLAKFPPKGLIAIAWTENGFRHMTNSKRAINKPEDVRGLGQPMLEAAAKRMNRQIPRITSAGWRALEAHGIRRLRGMALYGDLLYFGTSDVHIVADEHRAQFLEDEDQRVGHQHLLQVLALVEEAEEDPLEREAEGRGERDADEQLGQVPVAEVRRKHEREVGADHVEAAVRQVDDAHDSEDQRQPARDEEQQQPVLDPVQELDQEGSDVQANPSASAAGGPSTAAAPEAGPAATRVGPDAAWTTPYILQPRAGSASAFAATLTSLFSLPSTLRR